MLLEINYDVCGKAKHTFRRLSLFEEKPLSIRVHEKESLLH